MSDGGQSLFHFIEKVHVMINKGQIDIEKWKQTVKVIFRQMVEAIEYIHSHNICHYDVSIENWIINDVDVKVTTDNKVEFVLDSIQVKLCDFGYVDIYRTVTCIDRFLMHLYINDMTDWRNILESIIQIL